MDRIPLYVRACSLSLCQLFNNSLETAGPALNSIRAFCSTPASRLGNIAVSRLEDEGRTEVRLGGGDGGGFESQDLTGGNPLCLQCT